MERLLISDEATKINNFEQKLLVGTILLTRYKKGAATKKQKRARFSKIMRQLFLWQ